MMIRKRFETNWVFESPDAILACAILACSSSEKSFLVFGGHDKNLYLMDKDMMILDDITFDGWCRCVFTIDLDGDGCDEVLVGSGDGSCLVVKLDKEQNKFFGIMRYNSTEKINCCVAGDLYNNGYLSLIFGSEDKTLKIFKDIHSKEPSITFYYDSWVTSCTLGFLKLTKIQKPIFGLLVGTKNGLLQLISIKDDVPDIIWQRDLQSQINDIKIGDITNNGYNEIILGTDDSYLKILSSEGKNLRYIKVDDGRPLCILIEDIDGDNANEIIAGCADGSLRVYHNMKLDSIDIELKWKTKVSTSIKSICSIEDKERNLINVIFGGYDRSIRSIRDFEWGKKPVLQIPKKFKVPKVKRAKIKVYTEEATKIKRVPINLREHIVKFLEEKGLILNWDNLIYELKELGYSREQIEEELELMKTQKIIRHGKIDFPVWSLSGEEIKEKIVKEVPIPGKLILEKHLTVKQPVKSDFEKKEQIASITPEEVAPLEKSTAGLSLKNVIIEYLEEKKLVPTKVSFINDMVEKGYSEQDIEKEINLVKKNGLIQYSRSKPRGWSLVSEIRSLETSKPEEKGAITVESKDLNEKILKLLKEKEIIPNKIELINLIVSMGFDKELIENQIDILKVNNKIKYSRSKPRGWSLASYY
ncbi:MAG: hypothetical protein ACTSUT_09435 [Promethearchaeota archaeon]